MEAREFRWPDRGPLGQHAFLTIAGSCEVIQRAGEGQFRAVLGAIEREQFLLYQSPMG